MRLDWLELRVPPLALTIAVGAAMLALERPASAVSIPSISLVHVAGAIVALVGAMLALRGVVDLRRARTTVDPLRPDRSARLVTLGIYRATRNPMYLGFVLLLAGAALTLASLPGLALALLAAAYLQRFQINPEERILRRRFGNEFTAYCRRVRRWI